MKETRKKLWPFLIYLVAFHLAWTLWVLFGYRHLRALGEQSLSYALINIAIRILIWVLPVLIYLRFVDRLNPFRYLKMCQNWQRGILIGLAFTALNFLLSSLRNGIPHPNFTAVSWNDILSTSLAIGFFEEIPYRGFILYKLNEWMSFPAATLISSLLFLSIHLPGWITLGLFRWDLAGFVFVFGVLMAILVWYSKSLWSSITAHSLNDFLSAVIFKIH